MTVASTVSKTTANGNGATRAWPFSFPVKSADHLKVIITDPDGAQTTLSNGYTVALTSSGGTVTYPTSGSPLAAGYKITLRRVVPLTQETALANQDGFYAEVHEERFDLLAMANQQQQEQLDRTVKAPATDTVPLEFPTEQARATRILGFDAEGRAVAATTTVEQLDGLTLAALKEGKVAEIIDPITSDGTLTALTTTVPLVAQAQVSLIVGGIQQLPGSGSYTVAKQGTGGLITLAEAVPAGVSVGGFVGYATEVGKIVDDVGIVGGRLVIAYVDGETVDLGQVVGADGTNGRGVSSATVNGSGRLILTYTDSTTVDAGLVVGGVTSVAGRTGAVTLAVADVSGAAPLASPALTGTPTAPTATVGTNTSQLATTAFVAAALANLIGTAPTTLDTLNELAAALGNDPNFATTITNALAGKAPLGSPAIFTNVVDIRNGGNANALHVGNASGGKFIFVGWDEVNNYGRVGVYASTNAWLNLVINEGGSLTAIGTTTLPTGTAKLNVKDGIQVNGNTVLHTGNTKESIIVALGDETTAITAGAAKVTFRMPYGFTLTDVRGSLAVAGSSATIVNVKRNGGSIFSTKLQIDSGAKTSVGSVVPRVLADTSLADDAEITLDIDTAGTGAKGLKVTLIGRQVA